jgi:hypothetical protein
MDKTRMEQITEWLRPVNDKYGLPLAIVALVISLVALGESL